MDAISGWVTYWSSLAPSRTAIEFEGETVSWARLEDEMERGARALATLGVAPGDRVAVLMTNRVEYLTIWFAVARLGAVFVPLNIRFVPGEIDYVLHDSGTRVLITEATFGDTLAAVSVEHVAVDVDGVVGPRYADLLQAETRSGQLPSVSADQPVALMYTSGTTGPPKGAITTHGAVQAMTVSAQRALDYTTEDRHLAMLPLCFTGGLLPVCQPSFATGGTLLLKRGFAPDAAVAAVRDDRATICFAPPTMFLMMKNSPLFSAEAFVSMRALLAGAAPMPVSGIEFFQEAGVELSQAYGITEGCGLNLILGSADATRKIGSAGRGLQFSPARVVHPDGSDCAVGEQGELILSGPQVTRGYWNNDAATQDAIIDGWLHTGDVATVDEDGFVFVVDRIKDMIITGGMNVYPAEVEDAVLRHPGVAEVAVIGQPHEVYGETVVACVVPEPGVALTVTALAEHCGSFISDYKIPRRVELLDQLPRTTSGKVQKYTLREQLTEQQADS
jgi:fatty-acyl-CoA synthase